MRLVCLVAALLRLCCRIVLAGFNIQPYIEIAFLDYHNLVRSTFSSRPLSWSTTLASKSQTWANGCRFEHSNGQLGPYGENIAAGTGNFTVLNAMEMFMEGQRESSLSLTAYTQFITRP